MLQIKDTLVSLDLVERYFVCDLDQCLGECCVEGDAGAPLAPGEREKIEAVLPEVEEVDVNINPADLTVQTFRSSGAGGQHINKTESAVRIIHNPSGFVVECQEERSQMKNKEKAMKMLYSRLYEAEKNARDSAIAEERRVQVGTGDRSERIRTYNFPQSRVTDHRIGLTIYKLDSMMNGDCDEILDALRLAEKMALLADTEK